MNILVEALTSETVTENGAKTYSTSLNKNIDLFFGGAVITDTNKLENMIKDALKEDFITALKISFYLRDVREGQGKRDVIRALMRVLNEDSPETLTKILPFIPMIGRWKDVFENMPMYNNTQIEIIKKMISVGTQDPTIIGLMAKWMPRKGINARILTKMLNKTPKEYRRFVVDNSKTVEQLMCAKQWDNIEFEKVPSIASKIYQKAFIRNSSKYTDYVASLVKGETKVNSSILFPHDIISSVRKGNGNMDVLDAQWKGLPDYMSNSDNYNILPIIDTSGSMNSRAYGNVEALDIAVGLGIYLAQHNKGQYKDVWCNFSAEPHFYKLKNETIQEVVNGLDYYNWGTNTDINRVFDKLLSEARQYNVPSENMPKVILIISDMEFDDCGRLSSYEEIKSQYSKFEYECPIIVFWNVHSRAGNTPVRFNENGVVLIGGYSPAIMQEILKSELKDINPLKVMLSTITDKYLYLEAL